MAVTQTQHDSPAQTHTAGVNAITLLTAQSREGQGERVEWGRCGVVAAVAADRVCCFRWEVEKGGKLVGGASRLLP